MKVEQRYTRDVAACEICSMPATHFCSTCGKWLCDSRKCKTISGAHAVIAHPVRTATFLINQLRSS